MGRWAVSCVYREWQLSGDLDWLKSIWQGIKQVVYSDEVWTGIEYQVAAELIYNGWLDAGLKIVAQMTNMHRGWLNSMAIITARSPWFIA